MKIPLEKRAGCNLVVVKNNELIADSLRTGEHAARRMNLIQVTKLSGRNPNLDLYFPDAFGQPPLQSAA